MYILKRSEINCCLFAANTNLSLAIIGLETSQTRAEENSRGEIGERTTTGRLGACRIHGRGEAQSDRESQTASVPRDRPSQDVSCKRRKTINYYYYYYNSR